MKLKVESRSTTFQGFLKYSSLVGSFSISRISKSNGTELKNSMTTLSAVTVSVSRRWEASVCPNTNYWMCTMLSTSNSS